MATSSLVVKAAAINNDGKVLVIWRSKNDENAPGRVDLPGGGVDPGESFEKAMQREIFEEVGLRVKESDLELVYSFTRYDEKDGVAIIRLLYITHVGDQPVQLSHEHDAYEWQVLEEVEKSFEGVSWNEPIQFALEHQLLHI